MARHGSRLGCVALGFCLWFAYPFVFWNGTSAIHDHECRLAPAHDGGDPCAWDYIPIFDLLAFPVTLALTYPFAKLAFTLFAPDRNDTATRWWIAARSRRDDRFDMTRMAFCIGTIWVLLNGWPYPFDLRWYWAYWLLWIAWFASAVLLSWPRHDLRTTS